MKQHARVVVIGGGIVGVSVAYHLTKLGRSDVVLVEQYELTAGSTWHAAGLLPLFNMSYSVGQLHKYSIDLYQALEAETGQAVSFHKTGNLRLATNQERMDEYRKYCGTANTIGVPFELIGPERIAELWPLCEWTAWSAPCSTPTTGMSRPPTSPRRWRSAPAGAASRSTGRPRWSASTRSRAASGGCEPTTATSSARPSSRPPARGRARSGRWSASTCR